MNWDPVDQTVLANEQVIDGRGWRSGALVEQRELTQWFFKITDYSEDLLDALDTLDRWPEKVRLMQKNWIGRSRGPAGPLRARSRDRAGRARPSSKIFTTRPRHAVRRELHGASRRIIRWRRCGREEQPGARRVHRRVQAPRAPRRPSIETAEKQGFDTGIRAIHPFDPGWKLPVYVANFILMEYGTGAIFGCPAHDQRDLDFVRKYGLAGDAGGVPARRQDPKDFVIADTPMTATARMINSRFLDGMTIEAREGGGGAAAREASCAATRRSASAR